MFCPPESLLARFVLHFHVMIWAALAFTFTSCRAFCSFFRLEHLAKFCTSCSSRSLLPFCPTRPASPCAHLFTHLPAPLRRLATMLSKRTPRALYPDHLDPAFLQLAHGIEGYIKDITWQPTFDRFEDLPVELRYKIYEEYFLDDRRSLATREWPELYWNSVHDEKTLERRNTAPFLPSLCFLNKALLTEVGEFLFSALAITFIEPVPLMQFFQLATPCRLPGLRIVHSIRRLRFLEANGAAQAYTMYVHGHCGGGFEPIVAETANRATMTALNSCAGLHQLNLHFDNGLSFKFDHMPPVEPPVIEVEDIARYLNCFSIKPILALKELRELTITGHSGRTTLCSHAPFDIDAADFQGDTVSRLRPLVHIAHKLQDAFKARGQVV